MRRDMKRNMRRNVERNMKRNIPIVCSLTNTAFHLCCWLLVGACDHNDNDEKYQEETYKEKCLEKFEERRNRRRNMRRVHQDSS